MKIPILFLLIVLLAVFSSVSFAQKSEPSAYLGTWSNGRGEQLIINDDTVKYGKNRVLHYKDITKASDGNFFNLQIINPGKQNYFSRYVSLTINPEAKPAEMTLKSYNTMKDLIDDENVQGSDTWYLDAVGLINFRENILTAQLNIAGHVVG